MIGELSAKLTERFLQRPDGHTPNGSMWHDFRELQPAVCGRRLSRTQMRRSAATEANRQRRFGKPSARSGTPFGRPLRNRIQAIINNPRLVASCVGAVPKVFLARQVPTNGRRKTVAKTDSSGWRPSANKSAISQAGQCGMILRPAACGLRPARPTRAPTTNQPLWPFRPPPL